MPHNCSKELRDANNDYNCSLRSMESMRVQNPGSMLGRQPKLENTTSTIKIESAGLLKSTIKSGSFLTYTRNYNQKNSNTINTNSTASLVLSLLLFSHINKCHCWLLSYKERN